jgi:probable metal-binding protein
MTQRIHGHEVMKMMLATGKDYSRETLKADILATFGLDARFHTCSADNMTADDIITFLDGKGKFVTQGSGFSTAPDKICAH